MLAAIHGDVVIQTLGGIAVAGVTATAAIAGARRSKRAEAQLQPNGGQSFRDLVDRRFATMDERFERIERSFSGIARSLDRLEQAHNTGETPVVPGGPPA